MPESEDPRILSRRERIATLDREIAELKSDLGTTSLASDYWQGELVSLKTALGCQIASTKQAIEVVKAKDAEIATLEERIDDAADSLQCATSDDLAVAIESLKALKESAESKVTRLEKALQAETKHCGEQLVRAAALVETAQADNRRLREALEFYAADSSHRNCWGGWSENDKTPVNMDRGDKARAALRNRGSGGEVNA